MEYSQHIIDTIDENKVIDILQTYNIANLIEKIYYSDFESDIMIKKGIEHYILKHYNTASDDEQKLMSDYAAIIAKRFCLDTVHFSDSNLLNIENIPYIFSNDAIVVLTNALENQSKAALKLYKKMFKSGLNNNEKDYLMSFFLRNINTKNKILQEVQETYFKNAVKKNDVPNNKQELRFILSYASNQMLKEYNLNSEVYISDLLIKDDDIVGYSYESLGQIYISKNNVKTSKLSKLLQTIYHESEHLIQYNMALKNPDSIKSLNFVTRQLLGKYLSTDDFDAYKKNYRYMEVEIDADDVGYSKAKDLYYNLEMEEVVRDLKQDEYKDKNKREMQYEYCTDENNNIMPKEIYYVQNLNKIISDYPEYIKEYPVLNRLYNTNGTVKNFQKLVTRTPETDEDIANIYKDHLIYNINNNSLENLNLETYPEAIRKNILENIIPLWKLEKDKVDEFLNYDDNVPEDLHKIIGSYHINLFSKISSYITDNYNELNKLNIETDEIFIGMQKTVKSAQNFIEHYDNKNVIYDVINSNMDNFNNQYMIMKEGKMDKASQNYHNDEKTSLNKSI